MESKSVTQSNISAKDEYEKVDLKLSELMLKGWTLLASTCPLEECRCPLMRSPGIDKKKYCCNCEAWVYYNKEHEALNYNELLKSISLSSKNNSKTIEIIQVPSKQNLIKSEETNMTRITSHNPKQHNLLTILNDKINSLSHQLASELDYKLIKILLEDINLCLENIKEYNLFY